MKMHRCSCCKQRKPASAFNKNRSRSSGVQQYCRECDNAVTRTYPSGLWTRGVREMLLKKQGGRCAIAGCKAHLSGPVRWHLDHDHALPKTDPRSWRGVVCPMHNMMLASHDKARTSGALVAYLGDYHDRVMREAVAKEAA